MRSADQDVSPPPRTVLEGRIRERRETLEEFVRFTEDFARKHDEPGTLSVRHLQRLIAGARPDGKPLGPVRPATARLLEHIFGASIRDLLAPPEKSSGALQPLRVAIAVVVRDTEVLLVCRRDDANTWQFPAGIVKPGTDPAVAAVRETLAETDVRCVFVRMLGTRPHPMTGVLCEYVLCDYVTGEARNADVAENSDVIWVRAADLTRFIPAGRIYGPVLQALDLEIPATS
ncbi:NUDIX domain-containing protein [Amycolatopsis jejuensis]|uniref:NUDIX domain-containing protein n=1 Tax=Amycolatopsis jejuensis TaxID=330084 RepID=UPI0009FD1C62|nr:NUDIX hydrolase [Amycolatopsis jejuensis]